MANYRFFIDYTAHYLRSNSRHGVHSPFVYQLVDRVIYDYSVKSYEEQIENQRSVLKKDNRLIQLNDLGAGSLVNSQKQKTVKELANHALKPARIAKLIARLAATTNAATIIELGTCLGITTAYLAKASPLSKVISVEGCPQTSTVARENLDTLGLQSVDLRIGNFDDILPQIIEQEEKIDFLFIDGNHRKEATLNYFHLCLPKVHEKSILIFDDIYWSEGMKEAWQEIKAHPNVSITIDLFYIGLVFFKTDQEKEDFKIRFR